MADYNVDRVESVYNSYTLFSFIQWNGGSMLEKWFRLKANHTSVKTEVIAGLTTFLSAGYILAVVPTMLATTGMNKLSVMIATALISGLASIAMGLFANYPIALGPGLGTAALFAFTVAPQLKSWQGALLAVFIAGLLFLVVTFTGIRKVMIEAIPNELKLAIGVGIGFFITFIGLKNSGIIVSHPSNFVTFGHFKDPQVLLAVIGIIITLVLIAKNVPVAIFWGMIATIVIGFIMGCCGIEGMPTLPKTMNTQFDFSTWGALKEGIQPLFASIPNAIIIIFSFFFIDFFDTAGTLVTVNQRLDECIDESEKKDMNRALAIDSTASILGSATGVSSMATLVESTSGIEVGGRTGITAIVSGIFFMLSIFIAPFIESLVTPAVTAPALVAVGILMSRELKSIDWADFSIAASCMLTILTMVLSYSISNGIAVGFLVYTLMRVMKKEAKTLHPMIWVLDALFLIYFYFTY